MGQWVDWEVCRGQRSRGQWLVVTRTGDNWSITSLRYTPRCVINRFRTAARPPPAGSLCRIKVHRSGSEVVAWTGDVAVKVNGSRDSCAQCRNICWRILVTVKALARVTRFKLESLYDNYSQAYNHQPSLVLVRRKFANDNRKATINKRHLITGHQKTINDNDTWQGYITQKYNW